MKNALKYVHSMGVKNILLTYMFCVQENKNEFLNFWNEMIDKYELHDNSLLIDNPWLKSIFVLEEK